MADKVSLSQPLTNILLTGTNYLPWCRAITIALGGRSKLGHIDGTTKKPAGGDELTAWQANDHQVMSWIFNSMEPQIYEIFAYSDSAQTLWGSLKEMFGQVNNASRVFELKQKLATTKQSSDQPFIEHLSNLKK
jgi:gag-polypeptide of LTR copia-type